MYSSKDFGNGADAIMEVTCRFYDLGDTVEWDGLEDNNDFFSVKDVDSCLKDWEHPQAEKIESVIAEEKDAAFERGDEFDKTQLFSLDPDAHHNAVVTTPFITFNVDYLTAGFSNSGLECDIESVGIADALGAYDGASEYMVKDAVGARKAMQDFRKSKPLQKGVDGSIKVTKLIYLTSYWSETDYWGEWDGGVEIVGLVSLEDLRVGIHGHQANKNISRKKWKLLGLFVLMRNKWVYKYKWRIKRKIKEWKTRVGSKRKSKNI